MTVAIEHLIGGRWVPGTGDALLSVNPARPGLIVAQGSNARTSDVDAAVRAAGEASPSWAGAPMHQRGTVLLSAADIVELNGAPADVWTEELFGPVLAARRAVEQIDVGVLHVNSESARADPHVPFGGAKKSGLGPKEQGGAAREFFTHTTTVYLRGGQARA